MKYALMAKKCWNIVDGKKTRPADAQPTAAVYPATGTVDPTQDAIDAATKLQDDWDEKDQQSQGLIFQGLEDSQKQLIKGATVEAASLPESAVSQQRQNILRNTKYLSLL